MPGDAVLSKEPLRFRTNSSGTKSSIVGDLALVGCRIRGHLIAVKPARGECGLARAIAKERVATPGGAASCAEATRPRRRRDHADLGIVIPFDGRPHHQLRRKRNGNASASNRSRSTSRSGTFSGPSGDAGCDAVEAMAQVASLLLFSLRNDQPDRLFHERGRREVSQAGCRATRCSSTLS